VVLCVGLGLADDGANKMLIVYALVGVAALVAVGFALQQRLGGGSQPAGDQGAAFGYGSEEGTRARRGREAKEKRARRLAQTLAGLAGRLGRRPGWLRLRVIVTRAEGVVRQLLRLGGPGVGRLEGLLLVIPTRELWGSVLSSLWKAYDDGAGNPAVLRVSLLKRVCETGENRNVRLWALREMPRTLAASRQIWEIALPVLASFRKDQDPEIAEAAAKALAPLTAAEVPWAR